MGDRISISFGKKSEWKKGDYDESVALFNHWGGRAFLEEVKEYMKQLEKWIKTNEGGGYPLHRKEPETVMVDFIRWLTKDEDRITGSLYLGKDQNDGDNSDNGHWVYDLDKMDFIYR